jgi:hypothetical protein
MLVMYVCVKGVDVGHVFVLGVSMLVMHLCVRSIYVSDVFVC